MGEWVNTMRLNGLFSKSGRRQRFERCKRPVNLHECTRLSGLLSRRRSPANRSWPLRASILISSFDIPGISRVKT